MLGVRLSSMPWRRDIEALVVDFCELGTRHASHSSVRRSLASIEISVFMSALRPRRDATSARRKIGATFGSRVCRSRPTATALAR